MIIITKIKLIVNLPTLPNNSRAHGTETEVGKESGNRKGTARLVK